MYDEIDLPLDWPCEVNFYEAKAYCRWRGDDVRLLTELEHNVIRGLPEYENIKDDPIFCKGPESYNHNMTFGSSTVSFLALTLLRTDGFVFLNKTFLYY